MSAVEMIREAAKHGVWVGLDGERLALKAAAKPPGDLLDKLRRNKPEIITLLRQAACAVRPTGYTDPEWLAAVADARLLGYPPGARQ